MDLFGFKVDVIFLISEEKLLAYSWHYTRENAIKHMEKIMEFHRIKGKIIDSDKYEKWLKNNIKKVVVEGKRFELPEFNYRNKKVYEELIKVPRGKTITYSELSKLSGVKYQEVLITLMRNPFQVLIPCHRLLTKKKTLMGFYPLGKEAKKKLLEIEGIKYVE